MTRYFQLAEQKLCLLTPGYQSWKAPPFIEEGLPENYSIPSFSFIDY